MANPNKFTAKEVLNKVLLDSSGNAVTANSVTSQEALNSVLDTTNNRLNMSLAGGTISGDVTISGDLTVNGSATNSYDEIVNGDLHVKSDSGNSTSAFLVEKNDGTDVFTVDPTNSKAVIAGNLVVGTNNLEKLQFHDDNVGLQRASGSDRTSNGNSLYVSAFEDIVFTASGAAMGSQTERMRITDDGHVEVSTGALKIKTAGQELQWVNGATKLTGGDTYLEFNVNSARRFKLDGNSRISLSNNDSGGTGGSDSLSANTFLGYLAGEDIASGGVDNTYF